MRTLFALLSLCLLLPATGCRDAIVDPLPDEALPAEEVPGEVAPPPPGPSVQRFYLKGPERMSAYAVGSYRSEANPLATRYAWRISGDAEAGDPNARITRISVHAPGTVLLRVFHYDADGDVVGMASKTVEVTD